MKILIVAFNMVESSDIHFFLREELNRLGHETEIFAMNEIHPLAAAILEKSPIRIEEHRFLKWFLNRRLLEMVQRLGSEALLLMESNWFIHPQTLARLRQAGLKVVLWEANQQLKQGFQVESIPWYNHVFLGDSYMLPVYRQFLGAKAVSYLPGAGSPKYFGQKVTVTKEDKARYKADLSFIGSSSQERVEILGGLSSFDLKIWGDKTAWLSQLPPSPTWERLVHGETLLYGLEKLKVFQLSKIHLNIQKDITQINGLSNRTFEIASAGGFILSQYRKDIQRNFIIGKEIAVFRTPKEALDKIRYYLAHPQARKKIGIAAQRRVEKEHTYRHRAAEILAVLEKNDPPQTGKHLVRAALTRPKKTPIISVVLPTYNRSHLVRKAIRSVLGQTFADLELIVVNDGSIDETERVLESFRQEDPRFNYVTINNSGLAAARNTGIELSRGQYLAFLDDDDWWAKDKLAKQLKLFKTSGFKKNLGLVYCWHYWVDAKGNKTGQLRIGKRGDVFPEIIHGNMICGSGSAAMVKKECFEKSGLFNEKFGLAEDWEMWLRITNYYAVDFVPEPLVYIQRWGRRSSRYMLRLFLFQLMVDWEIGKLVLATPKRRQWPFIVKVIFVRLREDTDFLWQNIFLYYFLTPLTYRLIALISPIGTIRGLSRKLLYNFYKSERLAKTRRKLKPFFSRK